MVAFAVLHGTCLFALSGPWAAPASVTPSLEAPCCCPPGLGPSHPKPSLSRDPVGLRRLSSALGLGSWEGLGTCWEVGASGPQPPARPGLPFKTELGEARPWLRGSWAPPGLRMSSTCPSGQWCWARAQMASPGVQGPCLDCPQGWALCDGEAHAHVLLPSGLTVS